MKIVRILSASVLAGTVLFSIAACSSENSDSAPSAPSSTAETIAPVPSATATSTPASSSTLLPEATVTPTSDTIPANSDSEAIIDTVSGYYNFIASPDSLAKIKEAGSKFYGRPEITEAELMGMAADFPEGFQYFDTSSAENIHNSYSQLVARATQSERTPGVQMTVPSQAVTVTGNTAVVDSSLITGSINGEAVTATGAPYNADAQIKLVKNKAGKWVMLPEAPRQAIF